MRKANFYGEEVYAQRHPYVQWISQNEDKGSPIRIRKEQKDQLWKQVREQGAMAGICIAEYEECRSAFAAEEEIVLFVSREGIPHQEMVMRFGKAFEDPRTMIAYADEDVMGEQGERTEPWFKPDWSPDTLGSYFYFGSMFAIRTKLLRELVLPCSDNPLKNVYELAVRAVCLLKGRNYELRNAAAHVDRICFHRESAWDTPGSGQEYEKVREFYKKEQKFSNKNYPSVSIIIPSKDNPAVLEQCLFAICEKTLYPSYEILVVDNGSSEENKEKIEDIRNRYPFLYLYELMEFNFSAMCNLGVQHANGELLLLLNDDVEVLEGDWLSKMAEHALNNDTGAVGAKLLYPESRLIQHVGVTNLEIGPGHKLVACPDEGSIYHGMNRMVLNMLAVTAACLMIRRELYSQAGGLCEDLKVAYNDVDFCFTLYEMGYYNVQHNGVTLFHHESLSRGDDIKTAEKYERLLQEKQKLYDRHPTLYKRDPFYSRHLSTNTQHYTCNVLYPFEDKTYYLYPDKTAKRRLMKATILLIKYHVDRAELEQKMELSDSKHYLIDGWAFVDECDNAAFRTYVLLERADGMYWRFPVAVRFREDVMPLAANQKNAELSGFALRFPTGLLPIGNYRIVLLKKHIFTTICHYVETDRQIELLE